MILVYEANRDLKSLLAGANTILIGSTNKISSDYNKEYVCILFAQNVVIKNSIVGNKS